MSQTYVDITEDELIEQFDPETDEHGGYYRQRDWTVPEDKQAIAEADNDNRLWTMVSDDNGDPCLAQGYHFVNRLYYVICRVPYDPNTFYNVEMDL